MNPLRSGLQKNSIWINMVFWASVVVVSLYGLARAPIGFFADEAGIGVAAWQLLHGQWNQIHNLSFYHHLNEYYVGLLGPVSTMPFVFIFGLNELAVRAASVCYGLISLFVLSRIMESLQLRGKYIAIFLIWSIPLFFHPMRTQFALTPSLLFLSLSLWIFVRMDKPSRVGAFGVGLLGIASAYSNNAYLVSGTIFVGCMALGYMVRFHLQKRHAMLMVCYLSIGFMLGLLPYAIAIGREPIFLKRLSDKNSSSQTALISKEKVLFMATQYPRYYDPGYLLSRGEIDSPGSGNYRHSITGFGQFSYLQGGLAVFGLIGLLLLHRYRRFRYLLITTTAMILTYPLADIITQNGIRPPYTYSIFVLILPVTLCIMFGVDSLIHLTTSNEISRKEVAKVLIAGCILYGLVFFGIYLKTYMTPTENTAGFWGWQWGPREIMSYFKQHASEYDELYMQGAFNAGDIFIPFYDPDNECKDKCKLGGFEMYNSNKKQLFVVQSKDYDAYMSAIPSLREIGQLANPANEQNASFYFLTPLRD